MNTQCPEVRQLAEVCSNLSVAVDSLKDSLGAFRQEMRIEVQRQLSGMSQEICKNIASDVHQQLSDKLTTKEFVEQLKLEIRQKGNEENSVSETKDVDDGLVRLQASVSDPAQLEILKRLESMGFTNHTFNSVLLEMHAGDADKVIADLKKFYKMT